VKQRVFECPKYPTARSIAHALARKFRIECSPWTVNHDLRLSGFRWLKRRAVVEIDPNLHKHRVEYAGAAVASLKAGVKYCFADESMVALTTDSDAVFHYVAPKGERLPRFVGRPNQLDQVHVWGCIGRGWRHLVLLEGNVNHSIYTKVCLQPVRERIASQRLTLVQDNAGCHKKAKGWCKRHGIKLAVHPPHSPDLNVIEEVWPLLKRRISRRHPTRRTLRAVVKEEWEAIPQTQIDNIASFETKLSACISKRGKH